MTRTLAHRAIAELKTAQQRFNRSTSNLTEAHSAFQPCSGTMTAAQQVAHTARVIDWFMEGAFRPQGFDMNHEEQIKQVMAVDSLASARAWLERSVADAVAILAAHSDDELMMPLPQGEVMAGMPRIAIMDAICEHTAHHRGALTVYARLNGIVPADPYGM